MYPNTGYSAVYTQPQPAPSGGCPGGTGCSAPADSGFSALPEITSSLSASSAVPSVPGIPMDRPMTVTQESLQYLNGFLRTQIGKKVKVEFLVGTNTITDRMGVLVGVGANYILLNESETDDLLACDFYNIKFIRFYY